MDALKLSALYTFCNDESKSMVNVTKEWAKAVSNQRCPSLKPVGTNAKLNPIQTLMAAMLKHLPATASSSSSLVDPTIGTQAMEALFAEIAVKKAAGEVINLGHLKDFGTFSWLTTKEQAALHKQMIGECFSQGATRPAPVQQQRIAPKKKAKTKPGQSSTASFFKRRTRP